MQCGGRRRTAGTINVQLHFSKLAIKIEPHSPRWPFPIGTFHVSVPDKRLRIPAIATTRSNGSRPTVPIDRDQGVAGADGAVERWL
jgi:hypothetical protein